MILDFTMSFIVVHLIFLLGTYSHILKIMYGEYLQMLCINPDVQKIWSLSGVYFCSLLLTEYELKIWDS